MSVTWEILVICGEVLGIVGLLTILTVVLVRNRKIKELRGHVADQARDDRLRAALENHHASESVRDEAATNVAYDIAYHDDFEKKQDAICVQLVAHSPLSTKKYIFYIQSLIRIGSYAQSELVLDTEQKISCEVQLIRDGKLLYVKNTTPIQAVSLQRGRRSYALDERMVQVQDDDHIMIGKTMIEVKMLKV